MGHALKDLQLILSALVGPMAYVAWRLMLRPFWAMAIAVPASIVFLDPIRPYSHGSMLVLLPLLAAAFREIRRADQLTMRSAVLRGLGFGIVFGVMFLWYSGWYLWAAPGGFVLGLLLFPWRRGRVAVKRALAFLGAMLITAAVIGAPLLYQLARLGASTVDRYAYINTYLDPAYVMGWASDRAGEQTYHNFPVSGELAGQTGFGILLLLGVGLGVGLGLRNIVVRTAGFVLAGAWLLRFWFASHMAHNQAVQLYPRTTWIIFYCLIILAVLGLMLTYERGFGWIRGTLQEVAPARAARISPRLLSQLAAGLICVTALFATMGGSWSANRFMPSTNPGVEDLGLDALRAHLQQLPNGKCPKYSPYKGRQDCAPVNMKLTEYVFVPPARPSLWCANTTPRTSSSSAAASRRTDRSGPHAAGARHDGPRRRVCFRPQRVGGSGRSWGPRPDRTSPYACIRSGSRSVARSSRDGSPAKPASRRSRYAQLFSYRVRRKRPLPSSSIQPCSTTCALMLRSSSSASSSQWSPFASASTPPIAVSSSGR